MNLSYTACERDLLYVEFVCALVQFIKRRDICNKGGEPHRLHICLIQEVHHLLLLHLRTMFDSLQAGLYSGNRRLKLVSNILSHLLLEALVALQLLVGISYLSAQFAKLITSERNL